MGDQRPGVCYVDERTSGNIERNCGAVPGRTSVMGYIEHARLISPCGTRARDGGGEHTILGCEKDRRTIDVASRRKRGPLPGEAAIVRGIEPVLARATLACGLAGQPAHGGGGKRHTRVGGQRGHAVAVVARDAQLRGRGTARDALPAPAAVAGAVEGDILADRAAAGIGTGKALSDQRPAMQRVNKGGLRLQIARVQQRTLPGCASIGCVEDAQPRGPCLPVILWRGRCCHEG